MLSPKIYIKKFFALFGVAIINIKTLELLMETKRNVSDIKIIKALPESHTSRILKILDDSKSQLRQDIFVLSHLEFKRNGYFVEFGGSDGITYSNTYILEKHFGWTGIIAEPAHVWHKSIRSNRNVDIETMAVWSESGSNITFRETSIAELSTIKDFADCDSHQNHRLNYKDYQVKTISLVDLLEKYDAPSTIDYMSIDTEGSEFEILSKFDFTKYTFRVISCEHNFNDDARENIYKLLKNNGYKRVHQDLSLFDDWYIKDYANPL
ncbi:FkbM family methyltransferase [Polynucleobacter alcilacus]|uniref:FkbM family methyltransferase n=1 Tax=Polynucleobacter alcilacus TaxID=1819739 RepID=UPI001C0C8445|nr:FkbM family methyltransferase [Polynucleobacter alcilacus]MBU3568194.1 FkbM family methyltransferase [Polynucleobacter alcilacus]